jgi:moderate conductance mechanosensitive channel
MDVLDFKITPPWGGEQLDLGPYVGSAVAILGILVAAAIIVRLTHLFVRGILHARLYRENLEGTARDLTVAELKKRQDTIEALVVNVVRFFVVTIAVLMVLEQAFRLDIGPAIAGLGIAGIAVGLGTQSLVRDYLNGALILIENQYSIGDVVNVAGVAGVVEDFTLRRTVVRDLEGTLHTVPNGQVTIASNLTRTWARVHVDVRVAYGTDVERATAVVDAIGRELAADPDWAARILEAPHVERVNELGDLGITLLVLGKVRAADQWAVAGELRKRLLVVFGQHGIEMPQRVILTGPSAQAVEVPLGAAGRPGQAGRGSGSADAR